MTMIDELVPQPESSNTRDAIRHTAHAHRARRVAISRVMMILCGVALVLTAIPLVLLIIQLITRGSSQLNATFFTKLPQSPSLSDPYAIGETAPVLLTIGGGYLNEWRPLNPVSALPLSIYMNAKAQWPSQRAQVWGIALVLVAFVFVLSLTARIWASRKQKRNS